MAQVTMDGREYIELVNRTKTAVATADTLIETLIKGELCVDPYSTYNKVDYKTYATIPEDESMAVYSAMRAKHMVKCLEQSPMAVQLLFDEKERFIDPNSGNFTSYEWDNNLEIRKQSKVLDEMWQKLEDDERLVEIEEREEEEV